MDHGIGQYFNKVVIRFKSILPCQGLPLGGKSSGGNLSLAYFGQLILIWYIDYSNLQNPMTLVNTYSMAIYVILHS